VALNRDTGERVWQVDRPNKTRSYVTPLIRELAGRTQMILSGSKSVTSYDPRTGKLLLWYMDGPTEQFVASVVDDGELIYVTAGFPERHILAIRPDGNGVVSNSQIVWRTNRNCSYVPSPIIVGPHLLVAADNGVATCYRAQSGEPLWTERMGRQFSASLVASGGRVYFLSDDGVTKVVEPQETLKVLAENKLGENCYASPAIRQGTLFIRGTGHLWAIAGPPAR
jgi:outer membrane protein assembly factor BamB